MIKHAQDGIRDEAEESHVLLRATAYNGQPQILMLAQLVADNDQLEVFVPVIVGKFAFQNGKGLDQPVKVLVRPDFAGVQDERILLLIPFEHVPPFFRCMVESETFI